MSQPQNVISVTDAAVSRQCVREQSESFGADRVNLTSLGDDPSAGLSNGCGPGAEHVGAIPGCESSHWRDDQGATTRSRGP